MSKEKKQLIVVAVLAVLVVGIGAFQFMGGSAAKPVAEESKDKAQDDQVVAAADRPDATQVAIDNLISMQSVPRDPFVAQAVLVESVKPPENYTPPTPNPGSEISGSNNPVLVNPGSGMGLDPSGPLRLANEPPYSLRGIVIGRKTFAVLKPAGDDQVLVQEGDTLGDGTHVVSITERHVVLKHKGKVTTLALLGGNN